MPVIAVRKIRVCERGVYLFTPVPSIQFADTSYRSVNLANVSKFGSSFPLSYLLKTVLDMFSSLATSSWVSAFFVLAVLSLSPTLSLYILSTPLLCVPL